MPDVVESPLHGASLAIDFANTIWFSGGRILDALRTTAGVDWWLGAVAPRLADAGCPADSVSVSEALRAELAEAREQVRACLSAAAQHVPVPVEALDYLNARTRRAARWCELGDGPDGARIVTMRRGTAAQGLLAALSESAIEVAASGAVQACECPNCIGFFPPAPRRRFCSPQCSTRVRVDRHRHRD